MISFMEFPHISSLSFSMPTVFFFPPFSNTHCTEEKLKMVPGTKMMLSKEMPQTEALCDILRGKERIYQFSKPVPTNQRFPSGHLGISQPGSLSLLPPPSQDSL